MAHHPDDMSNTSNNEHFQDVLAKATTLGLTRRSLIRGGLGLAAVGSLPMLGACGGSDDEPEVTPDPTPSRALGFNAIDKSLVDNVVLPAGYT